MGLFTLRLREKRALAFGATLAIALVATLLGLNSSAYAGGGTIEKLRRAAIEGDVDAMTRLAIALTAPHWNTPEQIPEEDLKLAIESLESASRMDHGAAQYNLARFIIKGLKTSGNAEQDAKEIFELLRSAAANGLVKAKKPLAERYRKGQGCSQIPESMRDRRAFKIYQELVELGDLTVIEVFIGLIENGIGCLELTSGERVVLRFRCYEKQAEAGDARGMNSLAQCLRQGLGCDRSEENCAKALEWYKKSAELKNVAAMGNLATMLHHASGCADTEENKEMALYWYEQAAELGSNPQVMHVLADCFAEGVGCSQTSKWVRMHKAVKWYEKAAEQDFPDSKLALGRLYYDGCEGVKCNYERALQCLEPVKHQYQAYILVGNVYTKLQNLDKAIENYRLAAGADPQDLKLQAHVRNLEKRAAKERKAARTNGGTNGGQGKAKPGRKFRKKRGGGTKPGALLLAELEAARTQVEAKYEKLTLLCGEGDGSEAGVEILAQLTHDYEWFNKTFLAADTHVTRSGTIAKFESLLKDHEQKIQAEIQRQRKASRLTPSPIESDLSNASEEESSKEESRRATQETKASAQGLLAKANLTTLKKTMRVAEKPSAEKRAQIREEQKQKTSSSSSHSSEEEKSALKPFAEIRYEERTPADIPEAAMKNVRIILRAFRSLQVKEGEDAVDKLLGVLRNLEGDFNFIDVTPAYAGLPQADRAFELRINRQYRVVFGVVGSEILKDVIFIDDLH